MLYSWSDKVNDLKNMPKNATTKAEKQAIRKQINHARLNNKHQNHMKEKDKDKAIDLNFIPQVSYGKMLFSFNKEEDVLKVLGSSIERSVDIFNENEYVIYLDNWELNILVGLYFENNTFDRLTIHAQDILLDNFQFSQYSQNEILSFIKEYHNRYKLDFIEQIEYDKDVKETCYTFEVIGLTIWFDENGLSGINLEKTE